MVGEAVDQEPLSVPRQRPLLEEKPRAITKMLDLGLADLKSRVQGVGAVDVPAESEVSPEVAISILEAGERASRLQRQRPAGTFDAHDDPPRLGEADDESATVLRATNVHQTGAGTWVAEFAQMLVAGPNLALQRVADLDQLRPGEVLRFNHAEASAGGKGVNACRTALRLGARARLVTFAPGVTGQATVELVVRDGIEAHAVPCGGEARVASIVREANGRTTVLNEPGPAITGAEWAQFVLTVERQLEEGEVLICSGTLPPGGPDFGYAELVELAHARRGRVVVDALGALLEQALEVKPDLVKPNLLEAESTLGTAGSQPVTVGRDARERSLGAAEGLVAEGALVAAVTAGEQGAALAGLGPPLWIPAPRVRAVNPIGAGDSFAAVLGWGLENGRPLPEVFAYAVRVATASVEHPVPGDFDPRRAAELA